VDYNDVCHQVITTAHVSVTSHHLQEFICYAMVSKTLQGGTAMPWRIDTLHSKDVATNKLVS
jgi:hypothetical protein